METASKPLPSQVQSKTQILLALIDAATELRISGTPEARDAAQRVGSIWQHLKNVDIPTLPDFV